MSWWEKLKELLSSIIREVAPHVKDVWETVVPYLKQAVAVLIVLGAGGALYATGDWFITIAKLPAPWSTEVRAWLVGMPVLAVVSMVRAFHGGGNGSAPPSKP
jgi:hypothetical protein